MSYTKENLIEIYAEYHEMDYDEVLSDYLNQRIDNYDLLNAYLENEGIYGYTMDIWHVFNAMN